MEQLPSPVSRLELNPQAYPLWAEKVERIEASLTERFNQTDFPGLIRLNALPGLLEANTVALAAAIQDMEMVSIRPASLHTALNNKKVDPQAITKRGIKLTPPQVLELNRHPYTHAVSCLQLASDLETSVTFINSIVASEGIIPVWTPRKNTVSDGWGVGSLYNPDQIDLIKKGLASFAPPPGYLPESRIVAAVGIAPATLAEIMTYLGIGYELRINPENAAGERYISKEDTAAILNHMRQTRDRQRQT